jgi:DNA-dependent RNA polymerase
MPRADLLPPDDDQPWAFIAACVELYKADNNPNFISHLPISSDACCSGMQHLSAMMRDEVGGRYVNLIPGANEDLYEAIAMKVYESPSCAWRLLRTHHGPLRALQNPNGWRSKAR